MAKPWKDADGKYPKLTELGMYPLFYLDADNLILCSDCANREEEYTSPIVAVDIHWEGSPLACENDCGTLIESAYGVPDGEEA